MQRMYIDHSMIEKFLPVRRSDAHKGDFGKILLLCGSRGYTGAAALAAMGALRCGSGLVYLGVPESIYEIEAIKLNEAIVFPLPEEKGMLSAQVIPQLDDLLAGKDAVLLGPGLGQSDGVRFVVTEVLNRYQGPVVLDADGINVLQEHKHILRSRTAPTVITPHAGEFARLGGATDLDRVCAAQQMALDIGVIVVLKGHHTVITDGRKVYINPTGNPGMAVGGSGDVLAGMIASLLGQELEPIEAAACGVWLHGAAGDICASEIGQYGMLPSDMLNALPRLLK